MRPIITFIVVMALGCGTSGQTPPPDAAAMDGPGAGGDVPAATDAAGNGCPAPPNVIVAAPQCNSVTNSAHAVPFTMRTGTPPAPTGGAIRDGVYVATAAEGYGAVSPAGRRLTLVVTGGATQILWTGEVLDGAGTTVTLTFTANTHIAASGNQIAFTVDCASMSPSPIPASLTYTATADQLIMSRATGGDVAVTTYTRTGCLGAP